MGTEDTRRALISAAEVLFAESGVSGPSLREITRAAGQANPAALQYHFGDREGLLRAVLEKHAAEVDRQRGPLLDDLVAGGGRSAELQALVRALVDPAVARLDAADGGRSYLQIVAEVLSRSVAFRSMLGTATGSTTTRWSELVERFVPAEAVGPPLHRRLAVVRFVHGELASRAREVRRRDHELFADQLVDLVVAMLRAPVSASVRAAVQGRRASEATA